MTQVEIETEIKSQNFNFFHTYDFLSHNCDFGVSNNLVFLCHNYDLPKHNLFSYVAVLGFHIKP